MRRRHAVNLAPGPRLAHILAVGQQHDIAHALVGAGFKPICQDNLGNPVAINIPAGGIQWPRHIRCQDMPFPGRILKPSDLRGPLIHGEEVFLPIAVQVHRDQLVTELHIFADDLGAEPRQVLGGRDDRRPIANRGSRRSSSGPTASARR